jgi:tetratricopeptide (TPR) repeat protein
MAVAEPYAPCPCGSGQKYKWCCQKVESTADRAQRLAETGQIQMALETLDEGLRKEPDSPLLLIRKAAYLVHRKEHAPAVQALRALVRKQPAHLAAIALLARLELATDGPRAGIARIQQGLAALGPDQRKDLAEAVSMVGSYVVEVGFFAAALKHFELAAQLAPDFEKTESALRMVESNPEVTAWVKNRYALAEPPEGLPADRWGRFAEALGWARQGLWESAAAAFELLAADRAALPAADRNLGLCRLWLGDHAPAAAALRRSIARAGATSEAVDIEALCQQITPAGSDDMVEHVQWIWPLRDREALLARLRADTRVSAEDRAPIDPEDPKSPEVDHFALLDIAPPPAQRGLEPRQIPEIVGRVLVGQEIAALEGLDDGRLDALSERFTSLAGAAIARAHPKTKVLGRAPRITAALLCELLLPDGLDSDEVDRLSRERGALTVRETWPRTPMGFLRGRTPAAAAAAGDAEVPLRAAVMQLEQTTEPWHDGVDFAALRSSLRIPAEPAVDPETADVERMHLARLALVPAERLSDERLPAYYRRARQTMQLDALERAARVMIERPALATQGRIESLVLYTDLFTVATLRGRSTEASDWIGRGRQTDPPQARTSNAPIWDMMEIRLKARIEPPAKWVPDLAVVLERYSGDAASNEKVLMSLIDMGLIRLVARADRPEEIMIDAGVLQALMAEFGPRVTTASGALGVSAARGEIWTPGSAAGGGAIWTPGSETAPAPGATPGRERPKLIIPGR